MYIYIYIGLNSYFYIIAGILALMGGAAFFWSSYLVKKMNKFTGATKKATRTEENPVTMENRAAIGAAEIA
jgi:hypothetical protein